MEAENESVEAVLMEGASVDQLEEESRRLTNEGRMCIVFPSRDLMSQWLRRISAP